MLAVNRAKYAQHADLAADLLATGTAAIIGGPSTSWRFRGEDHGWQRWNGLIQTLIREELREPEDRADPGLLEGLLAEVAAYSAGGAAEAGAGTDHGAVVGGQITDAPSQAKHAPSQAKHAPSQAKHALSEAKPADPACLLGDVRDHGRRLPRERPDQKASRRVPDKRAVVL